MLQGIGPKFVEATGKQLVCRFSLGFFFEKNEKVWVGLLFRYLLG